MDQKAGISLEELCSDVLDEFRKYMGYVLALDSGDKPDLFQVATHASWSV